MLAVIGRGNQSQLDVAPLDLFDNVVAAAVYDLKTHQRVFLPEACQPPGGKEGRKARHAAKAQSSGQAHGERAHLLPGTLRQIQQLGCTTVEQFSGLRQLQSSAAAKEQRCAQLLLQSLNLIAQRRLAHIEPLGGPGKIQLLGNHREVMKSSKIHRTRLPELNLRIYTHLFYHETRPLSFPHFPLPAGRPQYPVDSVRGT